MAVLIRLLAIIVIIGVIYFVIKSSAKKETEDNIEDFKQRNEIHQLKEKLNEEKNDHQEEVEYLNNTITKLKAELAEAKSANESVD